MANQNIRSLDSPNSRAIQGLRICVSKEIEMNALELASYAPHPGLTPRCELSAVHSYSCLSWRIGKRHAPCNCGADELFAKVKSFLAATEVLDIFSEQLPREK
jgi:hypothetical protein